MKPDAPSLVSASDAGLHLVEDALAAGKLERAAAHCRAVLEAAPRSSAALAFMAEIEYKRGERAAALRLASHALEHDRKNARAHWIVGNLNQDEGKLDRAITSYRRALRADGQFAEAQNDLGTAYFAKGWHAEAEQCYRVALAADPHSVAATENLAAVLRAQGRFNPARDAFVRALWLRIRQRLRRLAGRPSRRRSATPQDQRSHTLEAARKQLVSEDYGAGIELLKTWLEKSPEDAEALHVLGAALGRSGKLDEAVACLERAARIHTTSPEIRVTLGDVHLARSEYVPAVENYQRAVMLDPGNAGAMAKIAQVLQVLGHYREAEEIYRLGMQESPGAPALKVNLATTLLSLGRYAEAEAAAREALAADSRSVQALIVMASALMRQGRMEEGKRAVDQAESIDSRNVLVLRWKAVLAMAGRCDFAAAEAFLKEAVAVAPADTAAHLDLAQALLAQQRFTEGWEEYEWRKRDPARSSTYTRPAYRDWDGSALDGKAILVNGEQGLGDEIMFASCLADLPPTVRRRALYCNRRLEKLFRRSFPGWEIVPGSHFGDADPFPALEGIDFAIAAGSLPRFFRRQEADFPKQQTYLRPDPERVEHWRQRLRALGPGLKVGLSWKGGTPLSEGPRRTLSPAQLAPLFGAGGVRWVSLQYGDCAQDRADLARRGVALEHWQDALDDLDETAALMSALELRISVCNTQVHIAGALGAEVWVLAPFSADWRYHYREDSMLWYPAARMFRQARPADWPPVIERVARSLVERAGA
ncbi:MAG: tetratricopeptide repeat protein [Betaproteobacteria bacterium]|nr:tetratricopeptide repeat protein [Betaproteobacteria bacterium]